MRIARVIASLASTLGLGGRTNFYEISIKTPIQPKMDVSPFQRVLTAGPRRVVEHRYAPPG